MRNALLLLLSITFVVIIRPVLSCATDFGWNEVGVRTGFPVSSRLGHFSQHEVFAVYGLPWNWLNISGWSITPHINTSLGVLTDRNETGIIASVGATMVLNKHKSGVSTELGINANLLDRRNFGNVDFGSILQFGEFAGISYRFNNRLKIGYRIQHMSNGRILYPNHTPNPGLDLHLSAISFVF